MKMTTFLMIAIFVLAMETGSKSEVSNNDDDFIEACLSSTNWGRPLCVCTAKIAKADLSPDSYNFLVATLNKDEKKAAMLRSKLDMAEAMAAGMFMTRAPEKCGLEMQEE